MLTSYPRWLRSEPLLTRRLFELDISADELLDALLYLAVSPAEQRRLILRLGFNELRDVINHANHLRNSTKE